MRGILAIASILLTLQYTLAIEPVFSATVAGKKIEIIMEVEDFREEEHKVTFGKGGYGAKTLLVDGKEPIGTDNSVPTRKFKKFSVLWNGVEKPISSELYRDYYQPSLDTSADESGYASLRFIVDPSGTWVQILMFASDGAGSYVVAFLLSESGEHKILSPEVFGFSN